MAYQRKDGSWGKMLDAIAEKLAYDRQVVAEIVQEHYAQLQKETAQGLVVKIPFWGTWYLKRMAGRYRAVPKVGRRWCDPVVRVAFSPTKRWRNWHLE